MVSTHPTITNSILTGMKAEAAAFIDKLINHLQPKPGARY
jgi:hypothetical protein